MSQRLKSVPGTGANDAPRASYKAIVSLLVVTAILSVDFYRQLVPTLIVNELLLYFAIPLLIVWLLFRESPLRYGLGPGHWREGLLWTAGGILLMIGFAWRLSHLTDFRAYYPSYYTGRDLAANGSYGWRGFGLSGLQMFAWEFLFRGFLLFALADLFGPYAIWIQTVPFALAHLGKPELESYLSILGGALSGWITYRVGSFYPAWLIHWALAAGLGWLLIGQA